MNRTCQAQVTIIDLPTITQRERKHWVLIFAAALVVMLALAVPLSAACNKVALTLSSIIAKGPMKKSLSIDSVRDAAARLRQANNDFARKYPGEVGRRQPVHTVYGGAHLFKADSALRLGALARRSLDQFAPDFLVFAKAIGLPGTVGLPDSVEDARQLNQRLEDNPDDVRRENKPAWLAHTIYRRVSDKLRREPVEDFRIDFEDGYGNRPDAEEDEHAVAAATEVSEGTRNETLPPFIGIRIKPFTEELRERSLRTLDIFVSSLLDQTGGQLPENFVVTLPKITIPEQVSALVDFFELLEKETQLAPRITQDGDDDRNHTVDHKRPWRDQPSVVADRCQRALRGSALWYLRLHRELQHHRRLSAHDASGL